ncbi:MAG: L,D-transpeptidase [Clostridia bacterium]|nr:L,D-transpeptidase [Clostridia bacterium]
MMKKTCTRYLFTASLILLCIIATASYAAEFGGAADPTEATEPTEEIVQSVWQDVWINTYVNSSLETAFAPARMLNEDILIPYTLCERLNLETERIVYLGEHDCVIVSYNNQPVYFFADNVYAIRFGTAVDFRSPAVVEDSMMYLSLTELSEAFGISFDIKNAGADIDLNIFALPIPRNLKNEYSEFVHKMGIASETEYMIWVSKANFRLCLFEGKKGDWALVKSFPCAIGAKKTPTCEGQYRFYSLEKMWKYDKYYVGPVMRFNRGYAIHSTLIRYNGEPYDDRVGVRISHGCIRLHKADIDYLAQTVPLYSRIYITGV